MMTNDDGGLMVLGIACTDMNRQSSLRRQSTARAVYV